LKCKSAGQATWVERETEAPNLKKVVRLVQPHPPEQRPAKRVITDAMHVIDPAATSRGALSAAGRLEQISERGEGVGH